MNFADLEERVKEDDMQLIHAVRFTNDFDFVNYKFVKTAKYYEKMHLLLLIDSYGKLMIANLNSGLTFKRTLETELYGSVQEAELSNNGHYLLVKFTNTLVLYLTSPFEVRLPEG